MAGCIITISAAYGAGGSVIAPRLAEELAVPYLDRVTPEEVQEAVEEAGREHRGEIVDVPVLREKLNRFLGEVGAPRYPAVDAELAAGFDLALRRVAEAPIWELHEAGDGGVILGRAAECLLRAVTPVVCVRLDGRTEAKLVLARELEKLPEALVWKRMQEADRARRAYAERLYGVDPNDPLEYGMFLNSPRLGIDTTVKTLRAVASSLTPSLV